MKTAIATALNKVCLSAIHNGNVKRFDDCVLYEANTQFGKEHLPIVDFCKANGTINTAGVGNFQSGRYMGELEGKQVSFGYTVSSYGNQFVMNIEIAL